MASEKKKIAIATGTRADWGLLLPLVKELKERDYNPIIIATYAHLFPEMGDTIQELVADGFPPTMSVPARMAPPEAVADTVTGFSKAFRFLKSDMVVILGDRFEMLGVATAALLGNVPIAHIAGGTVSKGAFDDSIRNSISQMATLHFPETEKGRLKLLGMGIPYDQIKVAGALGVFNVLNTPLMPKEELEESIGFKLGEKFALATFHPATLERFYSPADQMKIWLDGLEKALQQHDDLKILLTFPNTDNDPTQLLSLIFTFSTKYRERVKVVNSLGRIRYLSAANYASVVAGNSSSGIVEIPSTGTPVINVGERQEGRERSEAVINADIDADSIAFAFDLALSEDARAAMKAAPNPYFKKDTPGIIAGSIIKFVEENPE